MMTLILRQKRYLVVLAMLICVLTVTDAFCYQILKPYFDRFRPCYVLDTVRLVPPGCGGKWSFPSNHAANAMAIWVVLQHYFQIAWLKWLGLFLAIIVGISRIYLGVHYPFDVLMGFIIGGCLSFGVIRSIEWAFPRFYNSPAISNKNLG